MISGRKNKFLAVALLFFMMFQAMPAHAECRDAFFNPITDIDWNGIFPVDIGGVQIIGSDISTPPDNISSPICLCGSPIPQIGITASFWEPARLAETVKDPYCFPLLGMSLLNPKEGFLGGERESESEDMPASTFQQAHWFIFPVWAILGYFLDIPCLEKGGADIAYMTEVDPLWNDDMTAFIINPEALLFANPAAQLACVADSVRSNVSYPINDLFWCMGSWGSVYPLSGHLDNSNYVEANAGLAARMIYKLSRELLTWDPGINVCGPTLTPIWYKDHYRIQIAKPVRGSVTLIGRSGLMWAGMKNPPVGGNAPDNFVWVIFRRVDCCLY